MTILWKPVSAEFPQNFDNRKLGKILAFFYAVYPAGIYLFKVNNRNISDAIGVVLVSLLLTLKIFYTLL